MNGLFKVHGASFHVQECAPRSDRQFSRPMLSGKPKYNFKKLMSITLLLTFFRFCDVCHNHFFSKLTTSVNIVHMHVQLIIYVKIFFLRTITKKRIYII